MTCYYFQLTERQVTPLESWGGLPPVLCQGRRMEVRRGVLRCSSRKLRSSSLVELVAENTKNEQTKTVQTKGMSWDEVHTWLVVRSLSAVSKKFQAGLRILRRVWHLTWKRRSGLALTFAVGPRLRSRYTAWQRDKKITTVSVRRDRCVSFFCFIFELTATQRMPKRAAHTKRCWLITAVFF